jgi:hypothetical protein
MAINAHQLERLNADYRALTGKPVENFVCPVTLEDNPTVELCDGHILNRSIKKASRRAVVQRKDVDNYFGHTIEPDLVKYLNIPISTPHELMRKSRSISITIPSGEKVEVFFANEKAREKFQKVELLDADGNPIASPFLRSSALEAGRYNDLEVEWLITVSDSAMVGALIKSAYLALFEMLGYRYVLDAAGDKVRRALASFYKDQANARQAGQYFGDFAGCNLVGLNQDLRDMPDTLEDGTMMFHYAEGNLKTGVLLAITCLFRVNDQMLAVTLPSYQKYGFYLVAYEYYQALLKDRHMKHNVYLGRFHNDRFEIQEPPMQLHYTKQLPPPNNSFNPTPR